MKWFYALFIIALIIFIYPAAKYWLKNSPEAKDGDWQSFIFPIGLVILFVAGLIWIVSK